MVQIRKPATADIELLTDIAKQSFLESHGHSASAANIEAYVSRKFTTAAVEAELMDPANCFHLLYHDEKPAGYSKIILDCPLAQLSDQNITKLERLYLLQPFYGLQLGYQLLAHNLEIAKNANQAGVWLYTWTENHRAIQFYLKTGFQIVGDYHFKLSDDHYNPNHIMFLEF